MTENVGYALIGPNVSGTPYGARFDLQNDLVKQGEFIMSFYDEGRSGEGIDIISGAKHRPIKVIRLGDMRPTFNNALQDNIRPNVSRAAPGTDGRIADLKQFYESEMNKPEHLRESAFS